MPRFLLIHDTKHWCYITPQEIVDLLDIRKNPNGYTDLARCTAMIENPTEELNGGKAYTAFPVRLPNGIGARIHVEGRKDIARQDELRDTDRREPGHRCTQKCMIEAAHQKALSTMGIRT